MAIPQLRDVSTRADKSIDKEKAKAETKEIVEEIADLQNLLYAENKHALLIALQGMDASGKDGVIRNVFGAINPQGVQVKSFKAPTPEELSHDFLWRIHQHTPEKGMIKIFNRSHYEDILITRVHGWCDDELARKRVKAINDWEDLLVNHNSTIILKFYLHISLEEQQKRLAERLSDPAKMWKHNPGDAIEAKLWDKYMNMYQDAFDNCSNIPWHIIPSDQNWYKEFLIAEKVRDALKSLNMAYPSIKTA